MVENKFSRAIQFPGENPLDAKHWLGIKNYLRLLRYAARIGELYHAGAPDDGARNIGEL